MAATIGTVINDRLSVIVSLVVGTVAGFSMTKFLKADELKDTLIPISIAISLFLSFIISLSLRGRWTEERTRKAFRRLIFTFIGFIVSIALFFIFYNKYTIDIPAEDDSEVVADTVVIVKGLSYTPAANRERDTVYKHNGVYPTDQQLLDDFLYKIESVWSNDSRSYARILLLFLYSLMIAVFIGGITMVTEIIVKKQRNKPPPEKDEGIAPGTDKKKSNKKGKTDDKT